MTFPTVPEDLYVDIDGVNTRYWRLGSGERQFVMLHGGGASVEFWLYNLESLSKLGTVWAIDMMGSGKSGCPDRQYTLEERVDFIRSFLRKKGINKATFFGNSMGGCEALSLAIEFPKIVEALVLISPFGLAPGISPQLGLMALFPMATIALPLVARSLCRNPRSRDRLLRSNVFDPSKIDPKWLDLRIAVFSIPHRELALRRLLKNNFNRHGALPQIYNYLVPNLSKINIPTLVFWGKQDPVIPVGHIKIFRDNMSEIEIEEIDRCGHWAQLECAELFNNRTTEYLKIKLA
jgi:pimeloyl-ACP methyl ester carboxylesterase